MIGKRIGRWAAIAALVGSTAAITSTVVAGASSSPTTYYACLKGGLLSMVGTTKATCPTNAKSISWGAKGSQGPQGPAGATLNTCTTPPGPGLNYTDCTYNSNPDFADANLTGAMFNGAALVYTNFTNANLTGVDFLGTVMEHGTFTGANLTNANFTDADLDTATGVTNAPGITWSNTTCPDGTTSTSDSGGTCVGHLS